MHLLSLLNSRYSLWFNQMYEYDTLYVHLLLKFVLYLNGLQTLCTTTGKCKIIILWLINVLNKAEAHFSCIINIIKLWWYLEERKGKQNYSRSHLTSFYNRVNVKKTLQTTLKLFLSSFHLIHSFTFLKTYSKKKVNNIIMYKLYIQSVI